MTANLSLINYLFTPTKMIVISTIICHGYKYNIYIYIYIYMLYDILANYDTRLYE